MTFSSYNQLGVDLETTYVRRNPEGKTTWAHVIKKSEKEGYVKSIGEADPFVSFLLPRFWSKVCKSYS